MAEIVLTPVVVDRVPGVTRIRARTRITTVPQLKAFGIKYGPCRDTRQLAVGCGRGYWYARYVDKKPTRVTRNASIREGNALRYAIHVDKKFRVDTFVAMRGAGMVRQYVKYLGIPECIHIPDYSEDRTRTRVLDLLRLGGLVTKVKNYPNLVLSGRTGTGLVTLLSHPYVREKPSLKILFRYERSGLRSRYLRSLPVGDRVTLLERERLHNERPRGRRR